MAKRPGRPKLAAGEGKKTPINMRTTAVLRARLDMEAAASGRSLAHEVEHRLEKSFNDEDARLQGFGSEGRLTTMRLLALAAELAETSTGKDMLTDTETAENAYDAMTGVLDAALAVRPSGLLDKTTPDEGQEMILKDPGSRRPGDNIRDSVLSGSQRQLPAFQKAIAQKRKS